MTNRRIEIDVVLNTSQVADGFQEIEKGGKDVGKTFTGIGETFSGVGSAIGGMGDKATQKLGAVGESANSAISAITGLGQSATAAGGGFSAMLGPLGLVAVAVFEVVRAWSEYKDEVNGVNIRHDAYIAAVSELTSALEELGTNQVRLNQAEVERLQNLSMLAKLDIESAQEIREKNALIDKKIFRLDIQIKQEKESIALLKERLKNDDRTTNNAQVYAAHLRHLGDAQTELNNKTKARIKLYNKIKVKEKEAIALGQSGAEKFGAFELYKETLLKRSPKTKAEILNAEIKLGEDSALNQLKLEEKTQQTLTTIAIIESNRRIREIRMLETLSIEARNSAVIAEQQRLNTQLDIIAKQQALKEEQRQQKRRAAWKARRTKRLAQERKIEGELRQIRSLEIDRMKISGAKQETILKERYQLELSAAKDNQNLQKTALLKYENALLQISVNADNARIANRKKADEQARVEEQSAFEHRRNFIQSNLEFDAQMMESGLDQDLKLLELRYQREIELNKHTQEEITELNRRETLERKHIQDQALSAQFSQLQSMGKQLASAGVDAAYSSIVAQGEFKKGVGEAIFAIGKQAAVQAVFQGATSLARLAIGDIAGASIAGKAAAGYAGAAAIAGVTANRLGVGGGGSGSGGDTSPTALPQTQTTPAREKAESTEVVYNINFGGAVIYDTKTAAEQALADRLTNLQNRNRRGSPRPRRGT
jgi:hypothetical protein